MAEIADLAEMLSAFSEGPLQTIRKTAESPPRVSIYDVFGLVTGHSSTVCSHTFLRLQDTHPEIANLCDNFKFPGRGQTETPVCLVKDLQTIIARLPGKAASDFRVTGMRSTRPKRALERDDLYVMRYCTDTTAVKIGRSHEVNKRRKALESGQKFYVETIATFPGYGRLEGQVHKTLGHKQSTKGAGREWFSVSAAEAVRVIGEAIAVDCNEDVTQSKAADKASCSNFQEAPDGTAEH